MSRLPGRTGDPIESPDGSQCCLGTGLDLTADPALPLRVLPRHRLDVVTGCHQASTASRGVEGKGCVLGHVVSLPVRGAVRALGQRMWKTSTVWVVSSRVCGAKAW